MAETHTIVTKVWIAPGCIVCDACENDCPEVFDVQEATCVIRPPAQKPDFLRPLTPSIQVAAEGCPVEVIKYETKEVEGPAPWANLPPKEAAPAAAGAEVQAKAPAPAGKAPAPLGPPQPRWQGLLTTSKISPSMSASLGTSIRRSPEINQADEIIRTVKLPKNAPPDQRLAMLAVGGAYQPAIPLAERVRQWGGKTAAISRRQVNVALVVAWGLMAFVGATFAAMFQDFFGPKVLKEPKKLWRVGRREDYDQAGVYENYKRTPDGSAGFWLVNLADEKKLVALSTICTHLGCIPNWLSGENKFKCPCHGSGYYITGVNFEGPTPRPLERFAISRDPDGYLVVDMTRVYRQELGQWDDPESFVSLA